MIKRVQFTLITLIFILAPLMASGKSVQALITLEVLGLSLLVVTLWNILDTTNKLPKLVLLMLFFIIAIPIIYLIPIPLDWWAGLPGRQPYQPVLDWYLAQETSPPWLSLSIVPEKTLHALITLIPLIAVFLTAVDQTKKQLIHLIYVILFVAFIQAVLALIQVSSQSEMWVFFDSPRGSAQGTYLNRDHFSVLMYLMLPVSLGLLAFNIGKQDVNDDSSNSLERFFRKGIFLFILTFAFLIAGILSNSRAGVFLTALAIFLSSVLFARHVGGVRSASIAASITTLGIGLVTSIGLIPIINRFIAVDPMGDLRWQFFDVSLVGIKNFFPVGSGPSTFQEVYRTLQPLDQLNFINHAHNDYLELLFETGIAGVAVILLFLLIYIMAWVNIKKLAWHEIRFLKVGAGIGIFLLLLHSFVDFNFHTPANAIAFAFLAGLFFRIEAQETNNPKRKSRSRKEQVTPD